MKSRTLRSALLTLSIIILAGSAIINEAYAQEATPTPMVKRPLLAVNSYSTGATALYGGSEFELVMYLSNVGKDFANNIIIIFDGGEIYPRESGGVVSLYEIDPGETVPVRQKFLISPSLTWSGLGVIRASVSYTNAGGVGYSDTFTLSFNIAYPDYVAPTPTPTAGAPVRAQLVVNNYDTDIDPLQPGSIFKLSMQIVNLGMADAKAVSVVYGGGTVESNSAGTPQAGGVSGSSGDLSHFAPLGSSNIVYLGDIPKGTAINTGQNLIVNVNTEPGAYTFKVSFVYSDDKGERAVDDQVITLLVYNPPQLEVSFYRDPGFITAGQDNMLPLQVINLSRKTAVLGNMRVTAENADVFNNISLVGSLEPGGYYSLDASLLPWTEGPLDIKVIINYTDDFNQLQTFEQVLSVEVQPAMIFEPTPGEGEGSWEEPEMPQETSFWSKIWRFIKGLLGLGSGSEDPSSKPVEEPIPEVVPNNGMKGF